MAYKSGILLGRIIKLSGYEGAVAVKLEKLFFEKIPEMESVFLEIEGRPVPFFVSELEYTGADILKIKFTDYESIEKINEFVGSKVFLTTFFPAENETNDFQNFNGFNVFNQDNQLIGLIKEVISNNGQLLLRINSKENKEILVPFHDHFILRIRRTQKVIVMNIPEGLIDLN